MAFATSTELFQNVFMTNEPDDDMLDEFYDGVLDYLEKRYSIEEAASLYDWINAGRPMYGFLCRVDLSDEMSKEFISEHIPFLCVTEKYGNIGFLIRGCDNENAEKQKNSVLEKRSRYCEFLPSEELKKEILKSGGKDKSILYISGLSEEQAELMKDLCDENMDEELVGFDEMDDGTYTFSFRGEFAAKRRKNRMSLPQIYALLMMQTEGAHREFNNRIAKNRKNFEMSLLRGFKKPGIELRRTPAWVVGKGKHYMRFDGSGFEFGIANKDEDGRTEIEELYSVDENTPDYKEQMLSYLSRIEDRTVTYDQKQAIQHLEGKSDILNYAKTEDQEIVSNFEKEVIEKVDALVSVKIRTDPVMKMDGRWDEKLEHYLNETAKVIDGARMNKPPQGYTQKEIEEVINLGEKRDIKFEAYTPSIKNMRHMETTLSKARLPEIKDINKTIEKAREKDFSLERGVSTRSSRAPSRGSVSRGAMSPSPEPEKSTASSR